MAFYTNHGYIQWDLISLKYNNAQVIASIDNNLTQNDNLDAYKQKALDLPKNWI